MQMGSVVYQLPDSYHQEVPLPGETILLEWICGLSRSQCSAVTVSCKDSAQLVDPLAVNVVCSQMVLEWAWLYKRSNDRNS